MKKCFLLFQLIFTISVFSQGWNNTVTTSIYDFNFLGMDLFSNKNGNNLAELSWNADFSQIYYVKYYLLNSSGSIIRSSTIDTYGPYQGSIEYINISGDNDKVYVVYEIGGLIRAKRSTDAGVSWTTHDLNSPAGSGVFYGVDIVFDNITNKLHVVYSRGDMGYSNHITHYYSVNANNQWGEYKQVSDYGDEWTTPTVSFSQNRIHVSYHEDGAMSRDKYSTTWQTPVTLSSSSLIERIHAGSSKLFYFYAETQPGLYANMYVKEKTFNGAWSSPTLLHEHTDFYSPFVSATNTYDGKTHIVYDGPGSTVYRNYNGSTWSSEFTVGDWYENNLISSTSNDLFVMWMGSDSYIKYRQYDVAPLTPPNFTGTSYNNHPKLTWTKKEADLEYFEIYRQIDAGSWYLLTTTTNTYFIDNGVELSGSIVGVVNYKIRSKDNGGLYSPYTFNISYRYSGLNKTIAENSPNEYRLENNYPNPFNPSTKITYSIKEEGLVILKVYDVLGKEIATLVNENKPEGLYETEFDASQLPSGIYIYKLQAGSFTGVKKMILTK